MAGIKFAYRASSGVAQPGAGFITLYANEDGQFVTKDSAGVVSLLGSGTGSIVIGGDIAASDYTMAGRSFLGRTDSAAGAIQELTADDAAALIAPFLPAGGGSGTVTSVSGAGTVSGLTLTGTVTGAGSITLGGTLSTTSAALTDFASASRAQVEAELVAGSNITITPSGSGATRQLTIAATGGGGIGGLATITVPNSRYEWEETVTATGVTGTSRIMLSLAPALDTDENDPSFLDVMNMSATPGTGQITVAMAFATPAAGPIKLNWSAM